MKKYFQRLKIVIIKTIFFFVSIRNWAYKFMEKSSNQYVKLDY
jgi:hypothetical protein